MRGRTIRAVATAAAVSLLMLGAAACGGGALHTDAAVARFCTDTAAIDQVLDPSEASSPAGVARLARFQATLSQDIDQLESHGDSAVAAEAQVVQSLVSSLMVGGEAGVGPDPRMAQALAAIRQLRDKTC
jgi:hypothetical protein